MYVLKLNQRRCFCDSELCLFKAEAFDGPIKTLYQIFKIKGREGMGKNELKQTFTKRHSAMKKKYCKLNQFNTIINTF